MILICVFSDLLYSSLLITYIATEDEFEWKGYMYVGLLFSVSLIRTIMLQRYWHGCFVVGMRIRTAMTAAVYRKVRSNLHPSLPPSLPPSLMLQRYWHGCFVVGMRIRTAMTAAVYRKVRASLPPCPLIPLTSSASYLRPTFELQSFSGRGNISLGLPSQTMVDLKDTW